LAGLLLKDGVCDRYRQISNFLTVAAVKRRLLHQYTKLRKKSVKPLRRYRDFCDFQDGGRRRLGFQKIRNFTARSAVRSQYASPRQISSKIGQTIAEL